MKNLLLICLGFGLYSCVSRPADECPKEFEIPSTCLPYQETYQLGDTLTFFSRFHREVYENNTDKRYDLGNINWNFRLSANQIDVDSLDVNQDIREYFNIIDDSIHNPTWFDFSKGKSIVLLDEKLIGDTISVKIKLITKSKGIFIATVTPFIFDSSQDFIGKCQLESFEVQTNLNGDFDNNAFLLSESELEHYNTNMANQVDERFHKWGGYCFRVVE